MNTGRRERGQAVPWLLCFLLSLGVLLAPGNTAQAQEQRGSIEGTARDASEAVLPGATVEVKTATGVVLTTVTDGAGRFRFPSLPPGTYTVTANLSGFQARTVDQVDVGLGQIKKVDFSLSPAGVAETVQVIAESPLVDVRQPARQVNIRIEQVELLPKGRDFSTLVTQAPGANNEAKLGGISIDGASASENRYIIDGMETTDIRQGTSGKALIVDFVEEIQVKSSGYTAEYGGATGGVINVITKSGTNEFHGSALYNFESSGLQGERRPVLRQTLTNSDVAEYITYPKDSRTRSEPGFSLGGPIVRDHAWFFGAYQPAFTSIERTVDAASASNPDAIVNSNKQKQLVQYLSANLTTQVSDALRARMAFNNSWSRSKGLLPSLNATDPAGSDYRKSSTFPSYTLSGNVDWVASPNLFFGVRAGYYMSDQHDENVTEVPRFNWTTTTNIGFLDVPVSLQRPVGFTSVLSNLKVVNDQQTRAYFQADGSVYGNMAGSHQVKFGFQADRLGNDVDSGEAAHRVTIRWNSSLGGNRGPYGYYSIRSNDVDPRRGFITKGDISQVVLGMFVQDAWTINDRLTVNAGIRTERERIPYYTSGPGIPKYGIAFDFSDKIAPRLGAAYDINGDGRWKAFGSWGVFYDIFKLELPRGSFGGDKWLEYYYTLDTFNWPTLVDNPNCPPACSGRNFRVTDFRHVSVGRDAIEPDLRPMKQQEATAGLEHQLNDRMAVSVRYVHKQIDRAIEDTQTATLDADGNEIYIIGNPGEGLAEIGFRDAGIEVPIPKPVRDYDSVEFAIDKRFADNWSLRTSYLWSRLFGNYSGLSQSDENGRTSPNVGRLYDYPIMMFQDGGTAVYGPLATDRPHQFKTQFIYRFPVGTTVGIDQYVATGLPVSREIGAFAGNNLPTQYLGRGSDGRTPTYSQTNFAVQHGFQIGTRELQVSLNVLNLFNQDTAISKYSTYHKINGPNPNESLFYRGQQTFAQLITSQNVVKDPRFLMDNDFQTPIQARIGIRWQF